MLAVGGVAICYALGPMILARSLADLPSLGVVAGSLAITAVFYLPFGVAAWPDHAPDAETWLAVAGLAVICTAIAFIVFFELIAEVGPARSTVITYFNPAVALVLGALVLDEQITATTGLGFALILVGSVLATSRDRVAEPAPTPVAATGDGHGRRADGRRRRLPGPRALTAPHRTAPHRGHGTRAGRTRCVRLLARGIGYGRLSAGVRTQRSDSIPREPHAPTHRPTRLRRHARRRLLGRR